MPGTGALYFKAVTPRKLNESAFVQAFTDAMNEIDDEMVKDFQETVKTWEHSVVFTSETSIGPDGVYLYVYTTDEIYAMVNNGTPEHIILPRTPGGKLHFQGGFKPKTAPGVIGSVDGGKSGDWVHALGVVHPGFQARDFTGTIHKKWIGRFKSRMVKAMKQGRERCGHAY